MSAGLFQPWPAWPEAGWALPTCPYDLFWALPTCPDCCSIWSLPCSTILSEVESLSSSNTHDPRPLAGALSGTLAAGAALLRMLRGGGRQ